MYIKLKQTLKSLEQKLLSPNKLTLEELHRAYALSLKLRSQLLSLIGDYERYETMTEPYQTLADKLTSGIAKNNLVALIIEEPLPYLKEMTSALQEHWLDLIHTAIDKASEKMSLPHFDKAFVWIEITSSTGSNNAKLWDTSNRAINLIINNLKGTFFEDDNLEHMAFGVHGTWGETGKTVIYIFPFTAQQSILSGQIQLTL